MPLSKLVQELPQDYGYVILTGVGSALVLTYLGIRVGKARKEHGIEYPTMYSADNKQFNCVQRAHQNTLETYPQFLFLLLIGGLQFPRICAAAGGLFQLSRIAFAHGYYTGDPKNRRWGSFGYVGLLTMLGCTVCVGIRHVGCCKRRF